MANLYPDSKKTKVIFASSAEEEFYLALSAQLDNSWIVFHSIKLSTISDDEGLTDNEVDFAVYHPKFGLIVIEVKGGQIFFNDHENKFYTINRFGEKFAIKNPFQQISTAKNRLHRFLRKKNIRVPLCHAVCFPSVTENDIPESSEINPQIIIGKSKIKQLKKVLEQIAKLSHPEKFLNFADVKQQLVQYFFGHPFSTRYHFRDYIESQEQRLKDFEFVHETLVSPIIQSRLLGIEGEAGTGKTTLAVMLARHFMNEGYKVLLLSSNSLLNQLLKKDLHGSVQVQSYAELALSNGIDLSNPDKNFSGSAEDWIQLEGPTRLKQRLEESGKKYEVLICDEAQDVQPFWWEAFEVLLDKTAADFRFYLLFDRCQGVFGSGGEKETFVPEEVLPVEPPYFPLVHNYRMTREISSFAKQFRVGKKLLSSHCSRFGYIPQIFSYQNKEDFQKKLSTLIQFLVKTENVPAQEITILSARIPFQNPSLIDGLREIVTIPLHYLSGELSEKKVGSQKRKPQHVFAAEGSINVATVHGFKGLETSVAILINFSEYNLPADHPIMQSLIYVASTRAKHMLYVFGKEGDTKLKAFQSSLSQVEKTGTLTVDRTVTNFEYSGIVTYYNPERVGWLKVEDPSFDKPMIMFFPHDVNRSKLTNIKAGSKLKFRPQIEGILTFAGDLQII